MNIENPVSTIMSKYVKTLSVNDTLYEVKTVFDRFNIHHIPITDAERVLGMISKSDYNHFVSGSFIEKEDRPAEKEHLSLIKLRNVMEKKIISIRPKDPIRLAMEIFRANQIHALPVVENEVLKGIITPFDIMNAMLNEQVFPTESNAPKFGNHGLK